MRLPRIAVLTAKAAHAVVTEYRRLDDAQDASAGEWQPYHGDTAPGQAKTGFRSAG